MVRDLSDPWVEIKRLTARVRALEKATPLASSSVGRGRIRLYDGGELLIQDGNLTVSGTGQITGTLNVSGMLNVTGTTNLDGPVIIDGNTTVNGSLGITGPTVIAGDTDINGTLDVNGVTKITGNTTVSGNFNVTPPGKVTAGNISIEPGTSGGTIKVGGATINLSGSVIVVYGPSGVRVSSGLTELLVTGSGVQYLNAPKIARASANNAVVGTAWFNGNTICRVV